MPRTAISKSLPTTNIAPQEVPNGAQRVRRMKIPDRMMQLLEQQRDAEGLTGNQGTYHIFLKWMQEGERVFFPKPIEANGQ